MKKILRVDCINIEQACLNIRKAQEEQTKTAKLHYWNETWSDEFVFNSRQMDFIRDYVQPIPNENNPTDTIHMHKPNNVELIELTKHAFEVTNDRFEPRLICIDSYAQHNEQ